MLIDLKEDRFDNVCTQDTEESSLGPSTVVDVISKSIKKLSINSKKHFEEDKENINPNFCKDKEASND